jgi:quercetin dioxygenase-like cupin family protein
MKKVKFEDVKAYNPPGHINMTALKLQGKAETGLDRFWVGISHFLPGGIAEWGYEDNPEEKVYVCLEGEITVKNKQETIVLNKWDSLYLEPNEGREVFNDTNYTASMLVAITNPQK